MSGAICCASARERVGPIPWADPWIGGAELAEVTRAFDDRWLSMGPRVAELEALWSERLGARHAVAVNNGSMALELALRVLGVGPGDEVIVPAMTYVATANAVVLRGARPVFADIERQTWSLDARDLSRRITDRTKAVVYIDYGGHPADAAAILAAVHEQGIAVLQDGAQSAGGTYRGRPCGFQTGLSTTSFHAAKLVTTVEGGMVFTDDDEAARELRILRNQGEDPDRKYHHVAVGYNARMTDLQAAVGLAQTRRFGEIAARRVELAARYTELLAAHPDVERPAGRSDGDQSGFFFYAVLVPARDAVAARLRRRGIDTRVAYPMPVYRQPAYRKLLGDDFDGQCPVAEEVTSRVLNLPMFHALRAEQQEVAVEALVEAVAQCRPMLL